MPPPASRAEAAPRRRLARGEPASMTGMSRIAAAAVATACIAVAGCSSDGDAVSTEPSACPDPVPAARTDGIPSDVAIADFGTVTAVQRKRDFIGVEVISTQKIVEIYPPLARSIVDARYQILSGDNEGFEAEIFFARGKRVTGTYLLRQGPCGDQVTIKLVYTTRQPAGGRG